MSTDKIGPGLRYEEGAAVTARGSGDAPAPLPTDPVTVGIALHGPGASIEGAIRAGEALKGLLAAIGKEQGVPDGAVKWQIGSVQFQCDGCGLRRPDRPAADEGWTFSDSNDYCPPCSASRGDAS